MFDKFDNMLYFGINLFKIDASSDHIPILYIKKIHGYGQTFFLFEITFHLKYFI